jgi:hypothetical protein
VVREENGALKGGNVRKGKKGRRKEKEVMRERRGDDRG